MVEKEVSTESKSIDIGGGAKVSIHPAALFQLPALSVNNNNYISRVKVIITCREVEYPSGVVNM